jgi:ABC-type lipoprotein release transport system permease subunit
LRANAPLNEIIGVCADAKYTSLRRNAPPTAYFSYRQRPMRTATFALKTAGDPLTVAPAAREALRRLDPQVPVFALRTQEMQIGESLRRESLMARLATMLGSVTLVLSAIGLFGLLAGEVTRRTPEIGLRMALGAERAHVRWMVIRQSLLVVAAGLLIGIPAAIGGMRVLTALLFGLAPADPASLAVAAALIVLVGAAAAYLPARRASHVDPVVAIRVD